MVRMPGSKRLVRGLVALVTMAATIAGAAGPALATSSHPGLPNGSVRAAHLDPGLATTGADAVRVVVSVRPGGNKAAAHAVTKLGGRVGAALEIINGFAA